MFKDYELAIKKFLPRFRAEAAAAMIRDYGIGQEQAAELLEVTQAAVSKALSRVGPSRGYVDGAAVRKFVESRMSGRHDDAQRAVCSACQANRRFSCALMVK